MNRASSKLNWGISPHYAMFDAKSIEWLKLKNTQKLYAGRKKIGSRDNIQGQEVRIQKDKKSLIEDIQVVSAKRGFHLKS